MVICSYFLKGNCRFGDTCKNEHTYNDNASSVLLKKTEIDENALIRSTAADMQKAEKGNQWPLSCFGPFQGKPCFPGFEDKCFEEIRMGFYEAQRNGTSEQYKAQLTNLLQEARMKMKSLQNPTPEATNMLKEIYYSNGSNQKSVFGNQNTQSIFNNSAAQSNSIFGNKPESHSSSIFGGAVQTNPITTPPANNFSFNVPENKSIFGNTPTVTQAQPFQSPNSLFGSAPNQNTFAAANTQSIFGGVAPSQPVQNFPSNSIFQSTMSQNTNTHSQSIFGSPTQTAPVNPPAFGTSPFNTQNNQAFAAPFVNTDNVPPNSNPFLTKNVPVASLNPFQNTVSSNTPLIQNTPFNTEKPVQHHTASIFGNKGINSGGNVNRNDDPTIYSKVSDLSSNDMAQYEKQFFDFGKIPTRAPALEMC